MKHYYFRFRNQLKLFYSLIKISCNNYPREYQVHLVMCLCHVCTHALI